MQGLRILWNGLKEVWAGLKVPPTDQKIEANRKTDASLYWRKKQQRKVVRTFLGLMMLFGLMLAACGPGPKAITEGTIHDTIFSVEPRMNGTVSIWMTHDDVGVYCTSDKVLGTAALQILLSSNPDAIITYRSINSGDSEVSYMFDPSSGCGDNLVGTTRYKLLSVRRAE